MIEVEYKDGRKSVYDADFAMIPTGTFMLLKGEVGSREAVLSVPAEVVKNYMYIDRMTPKQIAAKLLGVMSETPHGSKWIAQHAGVEYGDGQRIVAILKKLREVRKVEFEHGKWRLKGGQ